jgi:hypothetical protein
VRRRLQRPVVVRSALRREDRHSAAQLRAALVLFPVLRHQAGRDRHAARLRALCCFFTATPTKR